MKCFISLTVLLGVASAAATRILICSDQTMGGSCVVMDVDGCTNFPGSMNDRVSSLNTGSDTCTFFVDGSCNGASWATSGLQNTVPTNLNDRLSSVRC